MYFRIMDYSEYIPNIPMPSWQDIALQGVRCYTWITMMWSRYFVTKLNNGSEEYPFAIVGKNRMQQLVYYSDIEETDYSFISGLVRVNDRDEYDLSLRSFFVVGNKILNRDFLTWYLKFHHRVTLSETDNYEVYIMDQNFEQVNISPNEYIKLNKDNYLKINYDD